MGQERYYNSTVIASDASPAKQFMPYQMDGMFLYPSARNDGF
jgi:hypothetical protein